MHRSHYFSLFFFCLYLMTSIDGRSGVVIKATQFTALISDFTKKHLRLRNYNYFCFINVALGSVLHLLAKMDLYF